ncbi:hypothetical protein TWF694_003784 [Orbilia ellipsospora]|uniref:HNH nuclease domain-containing protein n=1 Tax=Orbilia ellipsospora TaxID=2528407 RepID=A0AAV9WZ61_9PEZI
MASVPETHSFWSLCKAFIGTDRTTELFERYGGAERKKYRGNRGINALENGWILFSQLDDAFTRMNCYLEPEPDNLRAYKSNWLEEPRDLPRYSSVHPLRPEEKIKTGDIIILGPTRDSELGEIPYPSRTLLTLQAAIQALPQV